MTFYLGSALFLASLFSSSGSSVPPDGIDEDEEGHFITIVVHYLSCLRWIQLGPFAIPVGLGVRFDSV